MVPVLVRTPLVDALGPYILICQCQHMDVLAKVSIHFVDDCSAQVFNVLKRRILSHQVVMRFGMEIVWVQQSRVDLVRWSDLKFSKFFLSCLLEFVH